MVQANRTGSDEMPLMTADRARRGVPADEMRGKSCINAPNMALSSSLARCTPRQKCGPEPNARCGFG